jgi:Flp pilus assembly pilin Flp
MLDRFNLWLGAITSRVQSLREEDGQALVEYTLILGLISVVAITVLTSIGTDVSSILSKVESALAAV